MNYLPKQLDLPSRLHFSHLQFKNVSSQIISKHTQAILERCQQPLSEQLKEFKSEKFWQELKGATAHTLEVNQLFNLWKKVEPLAHLNTKQLLSLLEEDVLPLERGYEYLRLHFPQEAIVSQVNKNIEKVKQLKKHIYANLYARSVAYKMLKAPRHVDDILSGIRYRINKLSLLEKPFVLSEPMMATCNDDRRVVIHDLLKTAKYQESELDEMIFPVSRQSCYLKEVNSSSKAQLKIMEQFRNKIVKSLDLEGYAKQLVLPAQNKEEKQTFARLMVKKIDDNFKKMYSELGLQSLVETLYSLRYVFYFMLSILFYYTLLFAIQPLLVPVAAWINVETISSILFYFVGLFPLWIFSARGLISLCSQGYRYVCCKKKQEILDGLIVMEDLQYFICDKLSHYTIDIAHCDISEISTRAKIFQDQLANIQAKLNRFSFTEKRLFRSNMLSTIRQMNQKMNLLKSQFKEALKEVALHLALRVGQDLTRLDESLYKNELAPLIALNQLILLKNFIVQYGESTTLSLFNQNIQLETKWMKKIEKNKFLQPCRIEPELDRPWGKYDLQLKYLNGWQNLLQVFTQDPKKRDICLRLNKFLMNQEDIAPDVLDSYIQQLSGIKNQQYIKTQIQLFLFNTLHCRHPKHAQLLSQAQKDIIVNFYLKHKTDIRKANQFVTGLFSSKADPANALLQQAAFVENEKIRQYYELLDLEIIYYYAIGQGERVIDKQNRLREYFNRYQGEESFAYQLIDFLPRSEQPELIVMVANKRLTWILNKVGTKENHDKENHDKENRNWFFSEVDRGLFSDNILHESGRFDFTQCVMDSPIFSQPWSNQFSKFLKTCQRSGLDSGELFARYQARANSQPPILEQHKLYALRSKAIVNTNTKGLPRAINRVRCHA